MCSAERLGAVDMAHAAVARGTALSALGASSDRRGAFGKIFPTRW